MNMADNTSINSFTLESRAKKFQEGWVYHQPTNGKTWSRYWMVLRGSMLFIFATERTSKDNMKGTLTLDSGTELKNLPSESKKRGFKFELVTSSNNGDRKVNRFKFDKENERDVWKSFIVGIAVGIVPSDVHILPGQLKDVHEAIGEVRNKPPPLPDANADRPRIGRTQSNQDFSPSQPASSPSAFNFAGVPSGGASYNFSPDDDVASSDSGSFTSHLTRKTQRSSSLPGDSGTGTGTVQNLRELMRRQNDLANRELIQESPEAYPPNQGRPVWNNEPSPTPASSATTYRSTSKAPVPLPASAHPHSKTMGGRADANGSAYSSGSSASRVPGSAASTNNPMFVWEENHVPEATMPSRRPSEPALNGHMTSNHGTSSPSYQTHPFYADRDRNGSTPTWFFDIREDSRMRAEQILTMGRKFGNVLIRTSTSFQTSGKYVISMRREVAGGTKLDHYEVVQTSSGFKINVDNKHNPMRCLADVVEFFVQVAGPGTTPMATNKMDILFGRSMSVDLSPTSSPPTTPGAPHSPLRTISEGAPFPPSTMAPPPSGAAYHRQDSGSLQRQSSISSVSSGYLHESNPLMNGGGASGQASPMTSPSWAATLPAGGGFTDDTRSVHSGFSTTAADKLRVKGAVSNQIQRAVTDLNTGFSRSIVPAEIHAPPPAAPPPAPGGNWDPRGQDYVNIASMYGQDEGGLPDNGFGNPALNRTVPAKIPPMETMQRQAGHMDHLSHDLANMYPNHGMALQDELKGKLGKIREEIYASATIVKNY